MRHRRRLAAIFLAAAMCLGVLTPAGAEEAPEQYYVLDDGGFPVACEAVLALTAGFTHDFTVELWSGDEKVAAKAPAATGQTIRILDSRTGEVIISHTMVVMGDVLGTGAASVAQVTRIGQAITGHKPLEGPYFAAADFDRNGKVDMSDLSQAVNEMMEVTGEEAGDVECAIFPFVVRGMQKPVQLPLYFAGGVKSLPYISMNSAARLLQSITGDEGLSLEANGAKFVLRRENGSTAELDFEKRTITFPFYDEFFQLGADPTAMNLTPLTTGGGTPWLKYAEGSFVRPGSPIVMDLAQYSIPVIFRGATGYIPLQTFSDVFAAPYDMSLLYNTYTAALISTGELGGYEHLYYEEAPRDVPAELAAFSYNELCFVLDQFYGLKEQHNITSFDTLFRQTGLRDALLSGDAEKTDNAIAILTERYLADLHSAYRYPSFYAGMEHEPPSAGYVPSLWQDAVTVERFAKARRKAYPNGVPGYEEVGDTAYITFDSFNSDFTEESYEKPLTDNVKDTVELVAYAHSKITREGSPIKSVVVDISGNGGGDSGAAAYVLAWLRGTAEIEIDNSLTGAQETVKYVGDANLDGAFDEKDSITDKKRYLLISPVSFSCANLLAASLKGTDVTLVGMPTGGGASIIQSLTTASGTVFQISGPIRMCSGGNGSYYEADRGIEPDFRIARIENFYDREALTEYLANLPPAAWVGASDKPEVSSAPSASAEASVSPSAEATATPTAEGSASPSAEGSASPSAEGSASPSAEGSASPSAEESALPSAEATAAPTTGGGAQLAEADVRSAPGKIADERVRKM